MNGREMARVGSMAGDVRFDGLRAEASAAVGSSANALRSIRERFRTAQAEVAALEGELDLRHAELAKLELAERTLERTWLFLEQRGDSLLGADGAATVLDLEMRIVEAQEAERARLAREIHDGPAQALTNAIFQVDWIERLMAGDPAAAGPELVRLRDMLRRELGEVRSFINQLRPPLLDEIGLDGALVESAEHIAAVSGLAVGTDLTAPVEALDADRRTVVLRVVQEALQNVRKHAAAAHVSVTTRTDGADWVVEVRDDGRGFDVGAVAVRGRRNFGLQFMRERAELIGARLDVRSTPDDGTVVRLAIPTRRTSGEEES